MSRGEESPERKSSTSAKESKKSSSSSAAAAAAQLSKEKSSTRRPRDGGSVIRVREAASPSSFVNVAFDSNENSIVIDVADGADATPAAISPASGGMENGNVIIKSGSVTAANGKVERSAGASPVNHLDGGKEDGSVMFGLLRAPRL